MVSLNHGENEADAGTARNHPGGTLARVLLAGELSNGHCRLGESVELSEIAAKFQLDQDSVLKIFAEFQTLGMVTLSGDFSAVVRSPNPKETQKAYEIRAALEEIGGRAAARALKGNTAVLQCELDGMRSAFRRRDLDSFVKHDVAFHRSILQASGNEVIVRAWDSLAVDLRIRGAIGKVAGGLPEVVESHQPIVDALEKGRGREAGLLLRNHVETLLDFLRKSESDSGIHKALHNELENAKDVQEAFFPQENLSIPGLTCEIFYKPAETIGGDYYDFLPLQTDRWGIAIGDVSGKGIGAALLMAFLQASLRAQAMHAHSDLSTLIANLDRVIHACSPRHLYASLFYAEYDAATRLLKYVNAGHNAPIMIQRKDDQYRILRLEPSGTPLGLLEVPYFSSQALRLETGDVLVMYTDGITEAENPEREFWGQHRVVLPAKTGHLRLGKIRASKQEATWAGNHA